MNDALADLLKSLTIKQAQEYEAKTDKLMWIETELLDPANISRKHVYVVEGVLVDLLVHSKTHPASTSGWYEAQDADGAWHRVTDMQAAALRLDGVPTKYQTEGMKVNQSVSETLENHEPAGRQS
jgi:hypothetical protein